MKIRFEKQFLKDVKAIKDRSVKGRIEKIISELKAVETLDEISAVKKMKGHSGAYRLRLGSYRIGFTRQEEGLTLIRILHRKTIYKYFPK